MRSIKSKKKGNRKEKITKPPKSGQTNVLDLPHDCLGYIVEFLESIWEMRALMTCCKEFKVFFENHNLKRAIYISPNFKFEIKRNLLFIKCLQVKSIYSRIVKESNLENFPRLTCLKIEYSTILSTDIFKYFPNLEVFHFLGGRFSINYPGYHDLSHGIRELVIRNRSGEKSNSKRERPMLKIGETREVTIDTFANMLLQRPQLRVLELWKFEFLEPDYNFLTLLRKNLTRLRKLVLRDSLYADDFKHIRFPESLEELHLEELGYRYIKKERNDNEPEELVAVTENVDFSNFSIPTSRLRKLVLTDHYSRNWTHRVSSKLLESLYKKKLVFPQVSHLEFKNFDIRNRFKENISMLFPNTESLVIALEWTRDNDIQDLLKMTKLRKVKILKTPYNTWDAYRGQILRTIGSVGVVVVENVNFIVL